MALEEGSALGQQVLAEVPSLHGGLATDAGCGILQFGQVVAGDDSNYPRQARGPAMCRSS